MPERSDYTVGERTQVGARVDAGVYRAFREWVEEQTGKQYAAVGDALERAMLEFMDDDRTSDILSEIEDQTAKNEALIKQVLSAVDGDTGGKEKGNSFSADRPPQGKNPGDRKRRELHVVAALYQSDTNYEAEKAWTLSTIKEAVREVAGVTSDKTVRSYAENITGTQAFVEAPNRTNQWYIDRAAARELLDKHDIAAPAEVAADA